MKLIKINEDHYIIVDDLEIKEGDWLYSFDNELIVQANSGSANTINSKSLNGRGYGKITHSTQPESLGMGWMQSVQPLLLSEIKELIGEVDVEKRAETLSIKQNGVEYWDWQNGFKVGYNQALEDNKEKKYTEEDIIGFYYWLKKNYGSIKPLEEGQIRERTTDIGILNKYIQSLQPPTEWEVEFIDGKLKLA